MAARQLAGWQALLGAAALHGWLFWGLRGGVDAVPRKGERAVPTTFALVEPVVADAPVAVESAPARHVRDASASGKKAETTSAINLPVEAAPAMAESGVEVTPPAIVPPAVPGATSGSGAATASTSGTSSGHAGGVSSVNDGAMRARFDAAYGEALRRITAHRRYPELARRREIEGAVVVSFRVGSAGAPVDVRVARSADADLDEAALDAVKDAAPLPAELATAGPLSVRLEFRLDQAQ